MFGQLARTRAIVAEVAVGEQRGPGRVGVCDEQGGLHTRMDIHRFGEPAVGGVVVREHVVEVSEVERNGLANGDASRDDLRVVRRRELVEGLGGFLVSRDPRNVAPMGERRHV